MFDSFFKGFSSTLLCSHLILSEQFSPPTTPSLRQSAESEIYVTARKPEKLNFKRGYNVSKLCHLMLRLDQLPRSLSTNYDV